MIKTLSVLASFLPSVALASDDMLNQFFGTVNGIIASVFFFDVLFFTDSVQLPLAVAWLGSGSPLDTD